MYLVGSIGLIITKRTRAYPIATGVAVAVSVIANLMLVPRFGMMCAAWATTAAYAALALVAFAFAWRAYPIRYEWGRWARVAMAGLAGYGAASWIVLASTPPLHAGLTFRGVVTTAVYAATLLVLGFFRADELRKLRNIAGRAR